ALPVEENPFPINENIFNIFRNPASSSCGLRFQSEYESIATISISDILGRNLHQFSYLSKNGENMINLNIEDFPSGLYFVKVYLKPDKSIFSSFIKN
ncbi:MAG: Por Secre tail protein, partial [Bacteroidota bacterium]|nr:Por Secre tail protein [Bacteroidota bacterium]